MPAPNALFTRSFSGNYPLVLARQMQFESIKTMFWGKFVQFTTEGMVPVKRGNDPKPVDSPIVMQNQLNGKAGEMIEIPIHRNLVNLPRIGSQQMEGHEEEPKVNFAQVPVELTRHAEKPRETTIQEQVTRDLQLLKNTEPALRRHYLRVLNYLLCSYSLYYGYSWNVLASDRWSGDSKVSANSHPHTFVAGRGKVGYSGGYPGTSGYESSIATELASMSNSDIFDTDFLGALKTDPAIMKIKPIILKDGNECRLIIAHPWQIRTLENDEYFQRQAAHAWAQSEAKNNPMLFGAKYIWAGFAIYESDTAVFPVRVSSGVPQYGPSDVQHSSPSGDLNSFESYSSENRFGAIILGSNAIHMATVGRLEFKKRLSDYDELIGIAYRNILGAARADYWNREDGSTGRYIINESSAIAITWAQAPNY